MHFPAPAPVRARSRHRAAWLLGGIAAVATPFSCSESNSPAPTPAATTSTAPVIFTATAEATARLRAIRARFGGTLPLLDPSTTHFEATPSSRVAVISSRSEQTKTADVELPARAGAPVRLTDDASRLSVTFALEGAADVALSVVDGLAVYAGAAPSGGDLVHRVGPSGTEDFLFFTEAPARKEIRYPVDLGAVAGLRLVANTLEFLDTSGTPRLRVSPPYIVGADGRRREATIAVEGCAIDISPRAPWGRPVTPPGAPSCAVAIRWPASGVAYPALLDPVWGTTFNTMEVARTRHTMTLINPSDPKSLALIAGGFAAAGGAPLATAELYDPLSRRFSPTGSMSVPRGAHTATLLTTVVPPAQLVPAQPVLIAGGRDLAGAPLASLEVYDPASGLFVSDSHTMAFPRFDHTGTLAADNQVLLAGGITLPLNQPTQTAYLYTFTSFIPGNPGPSGINSTLVKTADMASSRTAHAAVRVNTGEILITGGFVLSGSALSSAELWSPATSSFGPITTAGGGLPQMSSVRGNHTVTLLNPALGTTLIVGGLNKTIGGVYLDTIDLYADGSQGPVKGFVQQANIAMKTGRSNHTATLLTTGDVLVVGGFSGASALSAEEVYSVQTHMFTPLGALGSMMARGDHAALLLNAGDAITAGRSVLVTGGSTAPTLNALALADARILLRVNSESCSRDDECLSGHCTDISTLAAPNAGKICCDTACNELCKSCSAQGKGGGADGVCGFSANHTDLGWNCKATPGQEVEIRLECDGQGNSVPSATNKCVPNTCNGNRCANDCPCSDAGYCSDAAVEAGPPDGGGGTGGASSSASSGSGTGGAGGASGSSSAAGGPDAGPSLHCEGRKPEGLACAGGRECNSGFCVDGYCCNVACTGQCEACDVVGKYGYCTPVGTLGPEPPHTAGGSIDFGGTLTPRQPCDGMTAGCTGLCGGVKTDVCVYPGSEKTSKPPTCAPDGPAFATTTYSCDGKGKEVDTPHPCGGFRCQDDLSACKSVCATDADCITDYVCLPGDAGPMTCQPLTGPLCDGDHTLRKPIAQGGNTPCPDHLTCPKDAVQCLTQCASVNDCVDNLVCSTDHRCVPQPPGPPLPSCSCRAVSAEGDAPASWTLALCAIALGAAGRRRRREET